MSPPEEIRLAIVEDEGLFRDLLRTSLAPLAGIQVLGAFGSADEALREIPSLAPDVVLMDIHLGTAVSGVEVALKLRNHLPQLGVVLLTNEKDSGYLSALSEPALAGFSYLLKTSVRSLAALERAIHGAASGFVVLDPSIATRPETPRKPSRLAGTLSERQYAILSLLAQGYNNAAIGEKLRLAEKTVENLISNLYRDLGIDSNGSGRQPRAVATLMFLEDQLS